MCEAILRKFHRKRAMSPVIVRKIVSAGHKSRFHVISVFGRTLWEHPRNALHVLSVGLDSNKFMAQEHLANSLHVVTSNNTKYPMLHSSRTQANFWYDSLLQDFLVRLFSTFSQKVSRPLLNNWERDSFANHENQHHSIPSAFLYANNGIGFHASWTSPK